LTYKYKPNPLGFFTPRTCSHSERQCLESTASAHCHLRGDCRSKRASAGNHRRSPRTNASENLMHLENEALAVQEHEDCRREEEIPRGSRRIRRRVNTTSVSATP
jgi:hypothetical protein